MPSTAPIRSLLVSLALCATAAICLAAVAGAAPNRDATLAPGGVFKWDGGPLTGFTTDGTIPLDCTPTVKDCDDTLIKIDSVGSLTAKISNYSAGAIDLDLFLFSSDASGAASQELGASVSFGGDETISQELDPGYYLVRVQALTSLAGTYSGEVTFEGAPVAPAPPGTTPPATNAPPVATIAKPKGRKITSIKGKASDDAKVASVKVGLLQIKGSTCSGLTASGSFKKLSNCSKAPMLRAKGTTSWSLKLRKALKKGKYTALAQATDAAGQASALAKRNFRVS